MAATPQKSPDPTASGRVLLRAGETIADRYRVRRVLAIGGMGVVYQVVSLEDGTPLAMKTLLPDLAGDDLLRRRFEREARAMRVLAHPGIVAIVDTVTDRGAQYLLMQLVSGLTLDKVQAGQPLDARRAFLFARQVLDALEHAHGHGIVHRDLKPQNLLVTRETAPRAVVERIKVLDFGIAKILHAAGASQSFRLTESGCTHGTPAYIAPEQARRDTDLDHRVDLYALGVMLFEMLTGVRPFDGPDDITIMRKHLQEPPPFLGDVAPLAPFTIPVVELVVATALAKDPDRRYRSAAAMRDALDEAFATLDARGLLSRPG